MAGTYELLQQRLVSKDNVEESFNCLKAFRFANTTNSVWIAQNNAKVQRKELLLRGGGAGGGIRWGIVFVIETVLHQRDEHALGRAVSKEPMFAGEQIVQARYSI